MLPTTPVPFRRLAPTLATASTVGISPARAFSVSSRAMARPRSALRTAGCEACACATQSLTCAGASAGKATGTASGFGVTPSRPTNWSRAMRLVRRSLSAAISVAVARSKRACASRVSVMVAVPTSKLRLAEANCSAMAVLLACAAASVSWATSTSK